MTVVFYTHRSENKSDLWDKACQNRLTVVLKGGVACLTDIALKALKPKEKVYKVADRDGMYVHVTPKGAVSFRLDYRLNGRRETVYLGK